MSSKKNTYHIKKVVVALLCLTAFVSCQFHELTEDCDKKGLIIVNLGLEGLSTRAAGPLFTGDDQIEKVRIFVFHGDVLEVSNLYTSTDDQFNNPFVMEVTTGTKDVYVVANESNDITLALENVTTKANLISIIKYQMNSALSLPLIMTGKEEDVEVVELVEPLHNSTYIELKRIAAKISLKFKKDTDKDVYITKVSLKSNTGITTIWSEASTVENQEYWNWSHVPTTAQELNSTALPLVGQDNLYFFENLAGIANKDSAVKLEVEALYNGIPTKYRVYLNEKITSPGSGIAGDPSLSEIDIDDHLYSIKRNHDYQLNGTIVGIGEFDGLILTTNVLPWNYLSSSISFERKFTINPIPTYTNHTYTVDSNGEVKFTFKLTSPIDASWVANLTLLGQFMFVGANQGITDEEIEITIKAINPPGDEEQTTEFYVNVGYGGNWSEVPLLSGSDLIGVGNRVIIRQPANQ